MAAVTETIQNQVSELYIAFFNRAGDAAGFNYWANELALGNVTAQKIADDFALSPEFVSQYSGLTPTEQIIRVYTNVLDRTPAPTDAGVQYWVSALNSGTSFGTVVWQIVNAAFVQQGTADGLLVQNKVEVAKYFALTLASNDTAVAKTAFVGLTSDHATVIAKEAELAAAVGTGATYTLTTAIETIDGTPKNDTFNGTIGITNTSINAATTTFQTGDKLDGKGGANVLNITVSGAATGDVDAQAATLVNITKIQDVNLRSVVTNNYTTISAAQWSKDVSNIATSESLATAGVAVNEVAGQVSVNSIRSAGNIEVAYVAGALGGSSSANQHFTLVDSKGSKFVVYAGAGAERITTATVESKGTASTATIELQDGGSASYIKTLVMTGAGALNLTYNGRGHNVSALEAIDASATTGGVTYNASYATASGMKSLIGGSGNDTFTINGTCANANVNLGAGNDYITSVKDLNQGQSTGVWGFNFVPTAIAASNVVDGGLGTDTITATSLNSGNAANIKNFEIICLDRANGSYDASIYTQSDFRSLHLGSGTATVSSGADAAATVTGLAGTLLTLNVSNTNALDQIGAITATLASSAGAGDAAVINFSGEANARVRDFVTTGVESVSIVSGGSAGVANRVDALDITSNTLATVKITGANALTLNAVHTNTTGQPASTLASSLAMIDGSAATGQLTITAGGNDTVNGQQITYTGLTINGGTAGDTITINAKNGIVNAGAGNDTINVGINVNGSTGDVVTVNGGVGSDTLQSTLAYGQIANAASGATNGNFVVFDATSRDALKFGTVANASGALGAKVDVSTAQNFDQAVYAAFSNTDNLVTWFQFGGNTYIENSGATNTSTSVIVEIVGLVDLSGATVVTGANGTITLA